MRSCFSGLYIRTVVVVSYDVNRVKKDARRALGEEDVTWYRLQKYVITHN